MKLLYKLFFVLVTVFVISISGCFSAWQDEVGTFSINFGGAGGTGSARNTTWDDDIEDEPFDIFEFLAENKEYILYTVKITNGPGTDIIKENFKINNPYGGSQLSFSVKPGRWTITVETSIDIYYYVDNDDGYIDDDHFSFGKPPVIPGVNNNDIKHERVHFATGTKTVTINPGANGAVSLEMIFTDEFYGEDGDDGWHWDDNWHTIINVSEKADSTSLADQLEWVNNPENLRDGFTYNIHVFHNESITETYSFNGHGNTIAICISPSLEYSNPNIPIINNSTTNSNSMFVVEAGITMYVDNVVLQGHAGAQEPLIIVDYGGIFTLSEGAEITGNESTTIGGGVRVSPGGHFVLSGGRIHNNKANSGGGVYVHGGIFMMFSGFINDNQALSLDGGGVYVDEEGVLNMKGGEIYLNTANRGGGVSIIDGYFSKENGTIYGSDNPSQGNTANYASGDYFGQNLGDVVYGFISQTSGSWFINITADENVEISFDIKDSSPAKGDLSWYSEK